MDSVYPNSHLQDGLLLSAPAEGMFTERSPARQRRCQSRATVLGETRMLPRISGMTRRRLL